MARRRSLRVWGFCAALWAAPAAAEAPKRVVSMNLCTDQLALMLAAPGQLLSVSYLAHDPGSSAMHEEAARLPANHGLAEEIFLLKPDLVLAGRYTTRTTVHLLQRLGTPVAIFEPEDDFEAVRANLRLMGRALGREAEAESAVARFEADLAALAPDPAARRPRAAVYSANGYTSGERGLSGRILAAAGFANVAAELGMARGGALALESLVLAEPDLVILGRTYPGSSRAEEILRHPALDALRGRSATETLTDRDWICGTPYVLRAVADLREARLKLEASR